MRWVDGVDRWIIGFEKKHGVMPEDALLRWIIRRPLRTALIILSVVSGGPFIIGFFVGAVFGAWVF